MSNPPQAQEIQQLLDSVRSFRAEDISHSELGTANGFQRAQDVKNYVCDFFIRILEMARATGDQVTLIVLAQGVEAIRREGSALRAIITEIDRLAGEGVHTGQFPGARERQIENLEERIRQIQISLQPLDSALRIASLEGQGSEVRNLEAQLRNAIGSIDSQLNQVTTKALDADKILNNLRDRVMTKGIDEAHANFAMLRQNHTTNEKYWFVAFLVSALVTLAAVLYVGFVPLNAQGTYPLVSMIIRRVLVISTPAVFMQLALSKFSLERNLRIIYDHRETVLAQYRNFETAIGDDAPAKQQFRLEIAKYIFSDPVTGYIGAAAASEVTINPVIAMIERVVAGNRGS